MKPLQYNYFNCIRNVNVLEIIILLCLYCADFNLVENHCVTVFVFTVMQYKIYSTENLIKIQTYNNRNYKTISQKGFILCAKCLFFININVLKHSFSLVRAQNEMGQLKRHYLLIIKHVPLL